MSTYKKRFVVVSVCILSFILCGLTFAAVEQEAKAFILPNGMSLTQTSGITLKECNNQICLQSVNGTPMQSPLQLGTIDQLKSSGINIEFTSGEAAIPAGSMIQGLHNYIGAMLKGASVSGSVPNMGVHWSPG